MEDLSHLCPVDSALTGGESMSAGNTVSDTPPFAAPGSVPVNPAPKGMTPDNTNLDIGPVTSYVKKVG